MSLYDVTRTWCHQIKGALDPRQVAISSVKQITYAYILTSRFNKENNMQSWHKRPCEAMMFTAALSEKNLNLNIWNYQKTFSVLLKVVLFLAPALTGTIIFHPSGFVNIQQQVISFSAHSTKLSTNTLYSRQTVLQLQSDLITSEYLWWKIGKGKETLQSPVGLLYHLQPHQTKKAQAKKLCPTCKLISILWDSGRTDNNQLQLQ